MELISLGLSPPEQRGNPLENPSVSPNSPSSLQWLDSGRITDSGEVNPEMTAFVYWETGVFHLSLTGNSFSDIGRSDDGGRIGLWPLNPRLTKAVRLPSGDL
jgi:hypothetical protein